MNQSHQKSQRGFSLVEVLIAAGLMSILSMGMMTMINDQNKANKSTQLTIEANELYNRVQRYMLDSKTCGDTLSGLVVAPGAQTTLTNIRKGADIVLTSAAPNNQFGGLSLRSMTLTRKTGALNLEFDLQLIFEKNNKANSIGSDTLLRTITLQAKFDPSAPNQVVGCFSQLESAVDTAVQESCDSVCPVTPATIPSACWDSGLKKCTLPSSTPASQFLYMSNSGLTLVKPLPTAYSCSNCGSDCSPCPAGWTELSNNCSRSSRQCGLRKWRNCNGMCINGNPNPVGRIYPP